MSVAKTPRRAARGTKKTTGRPERRRSATNATTSASAQFSGCRSATASASRSPIERARVSGSARRKLRSARTTEKSPAGRDTTAREIFSGSAPAFTFSQADLLPTMING